jgi:hypothetical protein
MTLTESRPGLTSNFLHYRNIMLDYPFPQHSWANEFAMPNDADLVIEMNHQNKVAGIQDPSIYLQIGSDGGDVITSSTYEMIFVPFIRTTWKRANSVW